MAESDERNPEAPARLEAVELEAVRGERELFSGLSFTLEAGEALQIEGANGCGKTTLLRILCGLTLPADGEVRWRGEEIQSHRADYFAELAYVGHLPGVKDDLTPVENLRMAQAMGQARADVVLEDALERLGLGEIEDRPCRTLSAGQKRRVALARLLATDATLWILDEPFTALDPKGRRDIEAIIAAHAAKGGMAILTTHHQVDLGACPVRVLDLAQAAQAAAQ